MNDAYVAVVVGDFEAAFGVVLVVHDQELKTSADLFAAYNPNNALNRVSLLLYYPALTSRWVF